jgi:hypothetical protein
MQGEPWEISFIAFASCAWLESIIEAVLLNCIYIFCDSGMMSDI